MLKKRKKSAIPRSYRKKFQELKKVKRAIEESKKRLIQRSKEGSAEQDGEIILESPKQEKMSDIIFQFAQPLLKDANSIKEEKGAISLAITGWNLALLPKNLQADHIKEITQNLNSSAGSDSFSDDAPKIFKFLIARKKSLFPKINRLVLDFELLETPNGLHLNVVSSADGIDPDKLGIPADHL
jgi:hypothetical protein